MSFQIDNICFSYENRDVLDDISISLEFGHFYGIVGPNGCGKTTFIDILMRHKHPGSGTVKYQNKNIGLYSRKELAREIALVPQNFYINFPFTAGEIVLMGRTPHIPKFSAPSSHDFDIVDDIMAKTGADKFRNRFITELSGGERQRVVFARALAQDTPVLMLDEGTSNLDINHTLNLLDIVAKDVEEKNKTVISVFQDINLAAMYCDVLIFMKQGKIAASGEKDKVLTEENIKKVFSVDSKIFFEPYSNSRKVAFKRRFLGS
ncbi:MAG: ABC transporter ATP-binding protein [Desulfobacterales bacterium]|nr:ABC transporter ATP-binding protein [Desulfobacterales bacterium]